jgi:hypothetical protein
MFTHNKIPWSPSDAKSGPVEKAIQSVVGSCESARLQTDRMQVELSHPFGQVFQRSRRTRSCPADWH